MAKSPVFDLILWPRLYGGVYRPKGTNDFEPVQLPGMGGEARFASKMKISPTPLAKARYSYF